MARFYTPTIEKEFAPPSGLKCQRRAA